MQHILLVLETTTHFKPLLVKALKFLPEKITILLFNDAKQVNAHAAIQTTLDAQVNKQCTTSIKVEALETSAQKEQMLSATLANNKIDMTVLHRPRIGRENMDFSLIKLVMREAVHSAVLLCGDTRWRSPIKLLGTLDIFQQNPVQQALNQKVVKMLSDLAGKFATETKVLSVIPISRIKIELDITDENEVLVKKEEAARTKLEEVLQSTHGLTGASVIIAAGLPAIKIASVASKQKVNLVVMGNVGRTGITGLLVGNTAEKILAGLGVDALIIRQ